MLPLPRYKFVYEIGWFKASPKRKPEFHSSSSKARLCFCEIVLKFRACQIAKSDGWVSINTWPACQPQSGPNWQGCGLKNGLILALGLLGRSNFLSVGEKFQKWVFIQSARSGFNCSRHFLDGGGRNQSCGKDFFLAWLCKKNIVWPRSSNRLRKWKRISWSVAQGMYSQPGPFETEFFWRSTCPITAKEELGRPQLTQTANVEPKTIKPWVWPGVPQIHKTIIKILALFIFLFARNQLIRKLELEQKEA